MAQRLLIVEDDPSIALLIRESLADLGPEIQVESVGSGEEALQELEHGPWNLLVTDQRMPGITGLELIEILHTQTPAMLTILITGYGSDQVEQAAQRLNVYHYLTKPFPLAELKRVILDALKRDAEEPLPEPKGETQPAYKVTLAGDASVGKTTLIRRLCTGTFEASRVMTIGVDFHLYDIQDDQHSMRLIVWDVSGQDRFAFTRRAFYRGSKAVGLVYDATRRSSFYRLMQWRAEIRAALPDVPMVLVGNKVDQSRQVSPEEGRALSEYWKIPFVETSCLSGDGVEDLFRTLAQAAALQRRKERLAAGSEVTNRAIDRGK